MLLSEDLQSFEEDKNERRNITFSRIFRKRIHVYRQEKKWIIQGLFETFLWMILYHCNPFELTTASASTKEEEHNLLWGTFDVQTGWMLDIQMIEFGEIVTFNMNRKKIWSLRSSSIRYVIDFILSEFFVTSNIYINSQWNVYLPDTRLTLWPLYILVRFLTLTLSLCLFSALCFDVATPDKSIISAQCNIII